VVLLAGDVLRALAAVVARFGARAGVQQRAHGVVVAVSRRPHERGQVVRVHRVRVDAGLEQRTHHLEAALARGVGHRGLVQPVAGVDVGAAAQEVAHDVRAACICRRHQRRHPVDRRLVHVGAGGEQRRCELGVTVLQHDEQRRLAEAIAGVDRGALAQRALEQDGVGRARGHEQPGVDRDVVLGEGELDDREGRDAGEKTKAH
jgi:hypothetical protein